MLALAAALVACSEQPEFPDWTISVPAGTRIVEYAPVPAAERTQRFELVEDLVIGQRGDDMNYVFGSLPPRVEVDSAGNFYVLDPDNHRVQAFDPSGEFRYSIGRQGQGPGEFGQPQQLAIAGETIVVFDGPNMRLGRWSIDGEHLGDVDLVLPRRLDSLAGHPDGTLVANYVLPRERPDDPRRAAIVTLAPEGQHLVELARVDFPSAARYPPPGSGRAGAIPMSLFVGVSLPEFAVAPGQTIYLSDFQEYQVLALGLDGEPRWALRVAAGREPVSDEQIERWMNLVRRRYPEARASEIEWPERNYALGALKVDGHGHAYVFPYGAGERVRDRPVDVYAADGERLAAGLIPRLAMGRAWQAALEDHVYGISQDQYGEWKVVRYRLVEPF